MSQTFSLKPSHTVFLAIFRSKRALLHGRHKKTGARPVFQVYFRTDQLPAPVSTVTVRRFCDQQEMLSQTATGRSLP